MCRSLFKRLWDSLVDVLSEDYYPSPSAPQSIDPGKLINMLDSIAQNLSATFEVRVRVRVWKGPLAVAFVHIRFS